MPESNPYKHYTHAGFSPDGKTMLISQLNGPSLLWNIEEKSLIETFTNTGKFTSAVFSPDGKTICTATGSVVSLWDLEGNLVTRYKINEDAGPVTAAAFSEGTNAIFALSADSVIRSLHVYGGLQTEYKLPMAKSEVNVMAFSPGAENVFTYANDHLSKLWNSNGGLLREINLQQDSVTAVSFSLSNHTMLIITAIEKASLWNVNGTLLNEWKLPKEEDRKTTAGAISPDGTWVVTGSSDGSIRFWNSNGRLIKEWKKDNKAYTVSSVVFTPNGERVLVGNFYKWGHGNNLSVEVYTSSGEPLSKTSSLLFNRVDKKMISAFSVDGRKMLSATEMFSIGDTTLEHQLLWHYDFDDALSLAFSTDGTKVIAGYKNGTIKIWESAMTLDEFLHSDKVEALTEEQRRKFGIK
jgi:WD40 repeat protein